MHDIAPLIYDLAIMLGVAGLVVVIFQRIHQPIVLGYLVAGLILGPHTPPYALVSDIANIQILSELGVIFLMFYLGLEFSFQKLTRVGLSASFTGFIEVIFMIGLGYIAGRAIGWEVYRSLFLGAALSISSTTIIIKAIDELHLKTKRFAELIFGILVVEDLLAILLLVALSTIVVTKNVFSFDMLDAVIRLVLVVGTWFLIGYFLMPPLFRRISTYINQETLTIISVALCLILVCIAANFHYSSALGAFIMGSILAETGLIHRIEDLIRPIRDIFAAVFFISVGMLIDPFVIIKNWPIVLFISLVTIIGKITATTLATLISGQSFSTSMRVGFSMAQIGEFSFIIVGLGLSLNVTDNVLSALIVAVSGITTFTTPYLIRISQRLSDSIDRRMPEKIRILLNMYSAWVYRLQASSGKPYFRRMLLRLALNAIIIAVIFTCVHYLAFHYTNWFDEESWQSNTFFLLLSLLLASPFIWGMLFTYKSVMPRRHRLTPFVFFLWLFTIIEISVLSFIYFNAWSTVILFLLLMVALFGLAYRRLEVFYRWFEHSLITNIQTSQSKHKYKDLAPWDAHLSEVKVSPNCIFDKKTLGQSLIRHRYGVNVIAIQHRDKVLIAPRGDALIHEHDNLIVIGDDEQLDIFRREAEISTQEELPLDLLAKFKLKAFLVESNNEFVGQSIRQAKIREMIDGLVVGLERKNARILNPNADTILEANDILLLVGEAHKLKKFKKKFFSIQGR